MPDLLVWFGTRGLATAQTVERWASGPRFSILLWLKPSDPIVIILFALLVIATITFTIGFHTRLSNITVWLLLASFFNRNPGILNGGDRILLLTTLLLIFAPSGVMYSLDAWLKTISSNQSSVKTAQFYEPWILKLLQLQIAAVYYQSFWSKLGGIMWRNGTAVYYVAHLQDFTRFPVPYLFDHLWTCKLLTWGTLAIEFSLWSLIWVKQFRYWVLVAGVILHLGIEWSMNIPVFEFLMICSYVLFIDPTDLECVFKSVKTSVLVIHKKSYFSTQ
jgi:hypothetical protein